jgi:D-psicose/D-tagatose/L-ribulose 3-epimerase
MLSSSFKNMDMSELSASFLTYKGQTKVGFNLLLWTSYVSEKMNTMASRLKETGYDGVEIAMAETADKPYKNFGKFLKSIDMQVSAVLAVGKEENPISESGQVREKATDKLKWAVDRANDLGAKVICGPMHSAFASFSRRPPSDDEYKRSAEVLHKAGEYAAASNVVFAVEAINRFECYLCNTAAQLKKLIDLTDHSNIKPMFDTHHANLEEKKFTSSLRLLKGSLAHVHISENDRGTPGDGHINWDDVFSTLASINYTGWLTIESFSRSDVDFANAINVWREYSKPWDVATNGFAMIKRMQEKYQL